MYTSDVWAMIILVLYSMTLCCAPGFMTATTFWRSWQYRRSRQQWCRGCCDSDSLWSSQTRSPLFRKLLKTKIAHATSQITLAQPLLNHIHLPSYTLPFNLLTPINHYIQFQIPFHIKLELPPPTYPTTLLLSSYSIMDTTYNNAQIPITPPTKTNLTPVHSKNAHAH